MNIINDPDRLKLLHMIHGLTIGGAEIDLLNKAAVLTKDYGYEITICCLMRRGELAGQAEATGLNVIGPLMRQRYDIWAAKKIRQLLLEENWALVHSHLFAANLISAGLMAALPRTRRPPLLVAEHAMAQRWGRLTLWLDRFIQRQSALFLVPSQAAADSYLARGLKPDKLAVLPNGIDISRFVSVDRRQAGLEIRRNLKLAPDDYLIGTVCRLEAVKNLPLLLEAIETLPAYLIIVGEGPERARLEAIIRSRQLDDRVQLLGRRSDIPQLLAAMDLFVLPSLSESFGIAVAEALLMETPVVASHVGGIPEVTCGDRYARLVPPGNVAALVEAVVWMMEHPDMARNQARQGNNFIQKEMTIESVVKKQHLLYSQLKNFR